MGRKRENLLYREKLSSCCIRKAFVEKSKMSSFIDVVADDAIKAIPKLPCDFIDLLFLDGSPEENLKYLEAATKSNKIGKGSIIIANDPLKYEEDMKNYLDCVRMTESNSMDCSIQFSSECMD